MERRNQAIQRLCDEVFGFCATVGTKLNSSEHEVSFLNHFHDLISEEMTVIQLREIILDEIEQFPDLVNMLNELLIHYQVLVEFLAGQVIEQEQQENAEDINPSYRLLPPVEGAGQRSEIEAQVLNDQLVSVRPINGSLMHGHKNKECKEALIKCEDDQSELDVKLNMFLSAAERVQELLNDMKENINWESPFRFEDHLSSLNIKNIKRMYDEEGDSTLEMLRENPLSILPVILRRLKRKVQELRRLKSESEKKWAQVYGENRDR